MTVPPNFHELRSNPDVNMDITPVRKSNWKTGGARDYWNPQIRKFRLNIALEYTLEILADPDHPQQAAIVRIGEDKIMKFAERLSEYGLSFNQVSTDDGSAKSIFTGYPNPIDVGGVKKQNVAISTSPELVSEFIDAVSADPQTEESYRTAAELLGMPDCCTEFHVDNAVNRRNDPVYEIACNTPSTEIKEESPNDIIIKHPDPFLNIFWRYNGWRFIQHLPCSFECEESGEIARRNYDTIAEVCGYKSEAEYLLSWLELPMAWEAFHGLTNLRNAYGIGSYTSDDHWSKKEVTWKRTHQDKPDFEPNHLSTPLEPLDPDRGAL